MAGQNRCHYPEFARALYQLQRVCAESRAILIQRANFTPTDTTAFDALTTALNTATGYFPDYVEPD